MQEAAFKLDEYRFTKASLDFSLPSSDAGLMVSFNPQGVFNQAQARYELTFDVMITCKETGALVVGVSCVASFSFENVHALSDIPDYFYPNSIAILFPYIRAFVSTMSLQANIQPILLATVNLIGLTDDLKNNTKVSD